MSYNCELCNYKGKAKSKLICHLKTRKHIKNVENKKNVFTCNVCNNSYKHRQSLYNHQMTCKNKNTQCVEYVKNNEYNGILETIQRLFGINNDSNDKNVVINNTNPLLEGMLKKIIKETIEEVMPTIISNNTMSSSNNIVNSNNNTVNNTVNSNNTTTNTIINNTVDSNNTINIQVFLNEHCKDAMTIQHFTKNLTMDIDDIVNKRKEKYFKGVSNIVIDNLKPIPITKRPIHCTDVKNSKWMINDATQGWTEDDGHKIIKQTEFVLSRRFNSLWIEKYPNWENDENKKDKWVETVYFLTINLPDIEIQRTLKKIGPQCLLNQNNMKEIIQLNNISTVVNVATV